MGAIIEPLNGKQFGGYIKSELNKWEKHRQEGWSSSLTASNRLKFPPGAGRVTAAGVHFLTSPAAWLLAIGRCIIHLVATQG